MNESLFLSSTATATRVPLDRIQPLRTLFLQEANCQIRYNACHERNRADSYRLSLNGLVVGYASVKGQTSDARDTVFEFYVIPPFRDFAAGLFERLLHISGARFIECQSNLPLLPAMLEMFAHDITADTLLFHDGTTTHHGLAGAVVRRRQEDDRIFDHSVEPVGEYVLEIEGNIVATGGFALHYNQPFADLYMEVAPDARRRGCATYLLQELKKACYLSGRVPAARCSIHNIASRGALLKAGMAICGSVLLGRVKGVAS